jgi:hypothetical protein
MIIALPFCGSLSYHPDDNNDGVLMYIPGFFIMQGSRLGLDRDP